MMNNIEIKKSWERAYQHARRRGYHSVADDFAQEACIAWLRGRKASPEQLLIDFLRQEYGGTRIRGSAESDNRRSRLNREVSIERSIADNEGRTVGDSLVAFGGDPDSFTRTRGLGVALTGRSAFICDLAEQGYLLHEIGEVLGFSESRASQLMKVVRREIEEERIISGRYDEYKDFKESSLLVIDWIAI